MKTLFLILALAITTNAQSLSEGKAITEWIPVAHGTHSDPRVKGDKEAEMSFAKVKRGDDTFKGWVRFVFPSSYIAFDGNWNETRFYVICDCRKNTLKALAGIAYGVDGNVRAGKMNDNLDAKSGTVARLMFEFFCERGGPVTVAPTLK